MDYIPGYGEQINFNESSFRQIFKRCKFGWCPICLIAAYYVYDILYPDGMLVALSFLQEVVLKANDDVYKGTKYSAMMAELNSKIFKEKMNKCM